MFIFLKILKNIEKHKEENKLLGSHCREQEGIIFKNLVPELELILEASY